MYEHHTYDVHAYGVAMLQGDGQSFGRAHGALMEFDPDAGCYYMTLVGAGGLHYDPTDVQPPAELGADLNAVADWLEETFHQHEGRVMWVEAP